MIEVRGASVAYEGRESLVLDNVDLAVRPGEIVSLIGSNGSGKSTLGSLLCAGMLASNGSVTVDGVDPASDDSARRTVRRLVGMVGQDPCDQIVATRVFDEVAFGPRNLGLAEEEVASRVHDALADADLSGYEDRNTAHLSGGEQQRVAIAGILAMHPRYLVLDEVTSQLDAALRPRFRALFERLAHEEGLGIVQITHDPEEITASDRVITMGITMGTVLKRNNGDRPGVPAAVDHASFDDADACALVALEMRDICCSYENRTVLENLSLSVRRGRVLLLAGRSGSGKSTLARIAAGLQKPDKGSVTVDGAPVRLNSCSLAFQSPESQFFLDTVYDEIAYAARNLALSEDEVDRRVRRAAHMVGLDDKLLACYPFDLSGGQARRVALASTLTAGAPVCILDEPSAGLDIEGRRFAHGLARSLAAEGVAVIVISHDLAEWLEVADDVALLDGGRIVWQGVPAAFDETSLGMRSDEGATVSSPVTPAQTSPLGTLDARVKIIGLLALTLCAFLCSQPAAIAVWLLVAADLLRAAGLGPRRALSALRPVCIVLAFALLANLVSCDGGAAVKIVGPVGIDPAGGLRGLVAVLRIAVLVGGSVAVAASVEPTEMSDAVVRLLRPLARLGLPVGALGTVLSIALRFIPLVGSELQRIRTAQRARGAVFDEGSLLRRISTWASVLTPLIVGLFRRADRLAAAMAARCYAGAGAVQVPRKPLASRDRTACVLIALVCVLTIVLALKGWV